jgi:hypothetical protein
MNHFLDLFARQARRGAVAVQAVCDRHDPGAIEAREANAWQMPLFHRSANQQAAYDELIAARVL